MLAWLEGSLARVVGGKPLQRPWYWVYSMRLRRSVGWLARAIGSNSVSFACWKVMLSGSESVLGSDNVVESVQLSS